MTATSHVLLLGAGFSRNWGGWLANEALEYLLGCEGVGDDPDLRRLLWRSRVAGGFERALGQVQANFVRDPAAFGRQLQTLQDSISKMFVDMNNGFVDPDPFQFQKPLINSPLRSFLELHDVIFTLNQDLFLEKHYFTEPVEVVPPRRWIGQYCPGMKLAKDAVFKSKRCYSELSWMPGSDQEFVLGERQQPLIKLHGSSNWKSASGSSLLVMGENKESEISLHPILTWYHDEFSRRLNEPGTRLIVIGYGFRDPHINRVITDAVYNSNLGIFLIDPLGSDLASSLQSDLLAPHMIRANSKLEDMFGKAVVGASRRSLREIFGGDTVEYNKVMRFFN